MPTTATSPPTTQPIVECPACGGRGTIYDADIEDSYRTHSFQREAVRGDASTLRCVRCNHHFFHRGDETMAKRSRNNQGTSENGHPMWPCEFGGVSIGDATARVALRIDRSKITVNQADETFVGHRLGVTLQLGRQHDEGQGELFESELEFAGVADCKRIGANSTAISTSLQFSLGDIDVRELAKFAKGQGALVIASVEAIPEGDG